jgi:hypothetical protein
MCAHDEASDLRLRLRAVGVPVGPYGNLSQLQSLWRHHIASRAGRGGGMAMASDAAWRRPSLPASLSFDAMYPALRARIGYGSGVFAVPSVDQRRGGGYQQRDPAMAYDSGGGANDPLSFDRMYPGLRERIKAG